MPQISASDPLHVLKTAKRCKEMQRDANRAARGNFVPIKADENFVYPDPAFWEKLAEGKIFSAETLAAFLTDFEGVRAAYARLFNVLALKFTSHGSESIQATEIHVMKGRLESMIHDSPVEKSTSTISKQRSQRSNTGSAPVAPAVVAPVSSIISADYDKAEVFSAEL